MLSGVGAHHRVLLNSRDTHVVPRDLYQGFTLNQHFDIYVTSGTYQLKGGVFYTMNITAFSRGELESGWSWIINAKCQKAIAVLFVNTVYLIKR